MILPYTQNKLHTDPNPVGLKVPNVTSKIGLLVTSANVTVSRNVKVSVVQRTRFF